MEMKNFSSQNKSDSEDGWMEEVRDRREDLFVGKKEEEEEENSLETRKGEASINICLFPSFLAPSNFSISFF